MPKTMIPSQKEKHPIVLRNRQQGEGLFRIGGVIPLAEHDPLWIGSSPRCITNVSDIIRTNGLIDFFEGIKILLQKLFTILHQITHVDFILFVGILWVH